MDNSVPQTQKSPEELEEHYLRQGWIKLSPGEDIDMPVFDVPVIRFNGLQ
jgi:hypothetical protein